MEQREPFVMHFGFVDGGFLIAGGMTIAVDDDRKLGFAICSPFDGQFDKRFGLKIAKDRLIEAPVILEDYNPQWSYEEKKRYLMQAASDVLAKHGGKQWRDYVTLAPRKEKFFTILEPQDIEEMLNNLDGFNSGNKEDAPKEKKTLINRLLGR